jgi:ABC-type transport system involved in multi-copper enzyme maturation permease subunit
MTPTARTRGLLVSEVRKAASTPVTYGFLAAILAFTALNTSLSLSDATARLDTAAGIRHVFSAGRDFLFLFIALGAVGAAGEFRHGTAVPTFLATPTRWRVLVAKLAAQLGLGATIALACVAVESAIALPWIDAHATGVTPWSAPVLEPAIGSILSGAAYCSLGVAVGMLVRNQILALAVTLGWFAVAEAALATFTPEVSRFLPGGLFSGVDNPAAHLLPLPVAAAVLAAYVAGLSLLAARTTLRRDIA